MPLGRSKEIRKGKSGRKCRTRGCITKLTTYNLNDYCASCMKNRIFKGLHI